MKLHPVHAYPAAVLEGQQLAGEWVRRACERHFEMLEHCEEWGIYFDPAAADRVIRFFSLLRQSKGPMAGKPLRLMPWQMWFHGSLYGWKRADSGLRLFRTAYLQVARKNGKSTELAGDGLYATCADGEPAGEVYSAATSKDQARIIFKEARRLALSTPLVRRELNVMTREILHPATHTEFRPLAADADNLDGLGPSRNLIDEMHAHKSRDLLNVLETGSGSRSQPLTIIATTSGDSLDGTSPCWQVRGEMLAMLKGELPAVNGRPGGLHMFAAIYELDEGDDWRDADLWIKSNPALGHTKDREQMLEKLSRAEVSPAFRRAFRVKELNQWLRSDNRLIDVEAWDLCAGEIDREALAGELCYLGVDLSSKTDLTAVVAVFPPTEARSHWCLLAWFFCPESTIERRSKEDDEPYDEWERDGYITKTAGARIDYDAVQDLVKDLVNEFDVLALGIDPWNAAGLTGKWLDAGIDVVEMRQGFRTMSGPTKDFLSLIADKAMRHTGNPVLDQMARNATAREDTNDNVMPKKLSKKRRIDGIVAAIMATGLAMSEAGDGDGFIDIDSNYSGEV